MNIIREAAEMMEKMALKINDMAPTLCFMEHLKVAMEKKGFSAFEAETILSNCDINLTAYDPDDEDFLYLIEATSEAWWRAYQLICKRFENPDLFLKGLRLKLDA